ncbi:peptidase inhibitor family I36 protein [Salinactinospora qingdaonensis]|uniref:Peptidase inhibitor family I36 n=1 Tax=Salinactinospora qingdaonensis TaxID=702744 RepID=A0ABP7F6D3_9ACTN
MTHHSKGRTVVSVVALTGVSLLTALAPAQAATEQASSAGRAPDSATMASGYFRAWEHVNYRGAYCRWAGNDSDWSTCEPGGNVRNKASAIHNDSYAHTYEDVRMYWGLDYYGASVCIPRGWYSNDIQSLHYPDNGPGAGESTDDNVSSHKWVASC